MDSEDMAARWAGLMNRLNVPSTVGNKWFQTVSKRYTEPQRHYHTLAHISELMGFANQFKAQIKSTELVELSIWFHDVIYEPTKGDNEEQSAVVFQEFAKEVNLDPILTDSVNEAIILTKTHKVEPDTTSDIKYFLDFDMAVLGKEPEGYSVYADQIRSEYIHVPENIYCSKRPEVLDKLAAGGIYQTPEFIELFEQRAKQNMKQEGERLRARLQVLESQPK